jgi:hypothetical protein
MAQTSGSLGAYIYGFKPTPSLVFYEWDVTEQTSPVGYRNVVSGVASFGKTLGTGENASMQFEDTVLDFSSLESEYAAQVQCFTFRNTETQYYLSNLRVWMPSGTALASGGNIEYAASGTWIYNAVLPSGAGNTMPTSLPSEGNVYNQNDESAIIQGLLDTDVSQFVYMGLTVPSGLALGRYGEGGTGDLTFRVTYDWYNHLIPQYATPEGTQYPRLWSYPDISTMVSGFHVYTEELWSKAPLARSGELVLGFIGCGNYTPPLYTTPPEWTRLTSTKNPEIFYKFYDEKDASGMNYQWIPNFSNGYDFSSTFIRVVGGIAPSGITWDSSEPASTIQIPDKSLVVYHFQIFDSAITELPTDVIMLASGSPPGMPAPTWAIGYKNYAQAGSDAVADWTTDGPYMYCSRVVIPYR